MSRCQQIYLLINRIADPSGLCLYTFEGGTKLLQLACLVCNRYFLHNWPQLAFLAYDGDHCFGTVVCKMDVHREQMLRGYLAMLVVEKPYRSLGTGMQLLPHSVTVASTLCQHSLYKLFA